MQRSVFSTCSAAVFSEKYSKCSDVFCTVVILEGNALLEFEQRDSKPVHACGETSFFCNPVSAQIKHAVQFTNAQVKMEYKAVSAHMHCNPHAGFSVNCTLSLPL